MICRHGREEETSAVGQLLPFQLGHQNVCSWAESGPKPREGRRSHLNVGSWGYCRPPGGQSRTGKSSQYQPSKFLYEGVLPIG